MRLVAIVLMLVLGPLLLLGLVTLLCLQGWIPAKLALAAACVAVPVVEITAILWFALSGHPGRRPTSPPAPADILYADGLVTITADRIIFHHYAFLSSREVPIADIHAIRAVRPTLATGRWRLGGTSDFQTYFPTDFLRFRRDTIFIAEMKERGQYRIGFSVKDSGRVRQTLLALNILHPVCSSCGYDLRASAGRCPECGKTMDRQP